MFPTQTKNSQIKQLFSPKMLDLQNSLTGIYALCVTERRVSLCSCM